MTRLASLLIMAALLVTTCSLALGCAAPIPDGYGPAARPNPCETPGRCVPLEY